MNSSLFLVLCFAGYGGYGVSKVVSPSYGVTPAVYGGYGYGHGLAAGYGHGLGMILEKWRKKKLSHEIETDFNDGFMIFLENAFV